MTFVTVTPDADITVTYIKCKNTVRQQQHIKTNAGKFTFTLLDKLHYDGIHNKKPSCR